MIGRIWVRARTCMRTRFCEFTLEPKHVPLQTPNRPARTPTPTRPHPAHSLTPYLSSLSTSQLKLLTIYYSRSQEARVAQQRRAAAEER